MSRSVPRRSRPVIHCPHGQLNGDALTARSSSLFASALTDSGFGWVVAVPCGDVVRRMALVGVRLTLVLRSPCSLIHRGPARVRRRWNSALYPLLL